MKPTHTPTAAPLKISLSKEFFSRPHGWADSDGKAEVTATFIAEGYNYAPNSEKGNCADLAAFIVRAVNSHQALIDALEMSLQRTINQLLDEDYTEEDIEEEPDVKQARAALKTAKGE